MKDKKLIFKFSTMNGGKTARLLMEYHSLIENDITALILKPSIDTRDGENIIRSRIGIQEECLVVNQDDNVYEKMNSYISNAMFCGLNIPKWVFVDEVQFFKSEQIDQLSQIVDKLDINVTCYGLRTDFSTKLFYGSKRLFEIADEVYNIESYCSCGNIAVFNARFNSEGNMTLEGDQILIGGNETYIPLCRKCYKENVKKLISNN